MLDNLPDPQTIAAGLRRAGVHLAKAGYEVAAAVGSFLEEVLNREPGEEEPNNGPEKIDID